MPNLVKYKSKYSHNIRTALGNSFIELVRLELASQHCTAPEARLDWLS